MLCVTAVKSVFHDKTLISNLYNEFGNVIEMINKCTVTKPIVNPCRFSRLKYYDI